VLRRQTKKQATICFNQFCSKSIEKAKYKRNNSTRKIAKNFQQKNIEVSNITVWRYMTRKGLKAFKRKKIPLLSEKQRNWVRFRFATKYAKLTGSHFKGNSDMVSKEFAKFYSQGWLASELSWSQSHWEHLEYHWRDNVQRSSPQNDERTEKVPDYALHGKMWFLAR